MALFTGMEDYGLLILRVLIGFIFIYHGFPKLTKFTKLAKGMGFPAAFVFFLGLAETLGGIGSVLGLFTQAAGFIFAVVMLGAIYLKVFKWKIAFYSQTTTGWEYDLSLLAAGIALAFLGAGSISFDFLLGF